jgi:sugar fermentation stimulation protein A
MAAVGLGIGGLSSLRARSSLAAVEFLRPLVRGTLVRRYKRFLADVILEDGRAVTAHCANPGAMLGLADPGQGVWLEPVDDPGRKLRFSWRLAELGRGRFAGIDTSVPNRLVAEALAEGAIADLAGYGEVRSEVRYGTGSRVDFLLTAPDRPPAYVEVKNVHLRRDGDWAEFPDCVTARGAKHLRELSAMVVAGNRAVTLYVIQRDDCDRFRLAADLDPGYALAFAAAREAGVEAIAHATRISRKGIRLDRAVPVSVPQPGGW